MKKNELRDALTERGIPPILYNLDGNGRTDERVWNIQIVSGEFTSLKEE